MKGIIILCFFILACIASVVCLVLSSLAFIRVQNVASSENTVSTELAAFAMTTTFPDDAFRIYHESDPTKLLAYSCNFLPNRTSTIYVPDSDSYQPTDCGTDSILVNRQYDLSTENTNQTTMYGVSINFPGLGNRNCRIGYEGSSQNSSGTDNVIIGSLTSNSFTTGSENVICGNNSVGTLQTGNRNILLGRNISTTQNSTLGAIAIGSSLSGINSHTVTISAPSNAVGCFVNAIRSAAGGTILTYNSSNFEMTSQVYTPPSSAALTTGNDTNVNLSATGTTSSCVLNAVSLTLGWSGILPMTRGGTGTSSYTPTAGTLLYCDGTTVTNTGAGTTGQLLQSQGSSAPVWSDALPIVSFGTGTPNDSQSVAITTLSQTNMGTGSLQTMGNSGSNSGANTAYGRQVLASLSDNKSSLTNTGFGYYAGSAMTLGQDNVFSGYRSGALAVGINMNRNIGVGSYSIGNSTNTSLSDNIALGYSTLNNAILTGTDCLAIGTSALTNDIASRNLGIGELCLSTNTIGTDNVGCGYNALGGNIGSQCTVVGHNAQSASSAMGSNVTAVGFEASKSNTVDSTTALGSGALTSNTTGARNTAMGYQSMYSNVSGSDNTSSGSTALYGNVSGSRNTVFGASAQTIVANVSDVTAYGSLCCQNNTANETTGVGWSCLAQNTGIQNTGMGSGVCSSNTSGSYITVVGSNAASGNVSGSYITAVCQDAILNNVSGSHNISVGTRSQTMNVNGSWNVSVGIESLSALDSRTAAMSYNTAYGYRTLFSDSGSYNTAIGFASGITNDTSASPIKQLYHTGFTGILGKGRITANTNAQYITSFGLLYVSAENCMYSICFGNNDITNTNQIVIGNFLSDIAITTNTFIDGIRGRDVDVNTAQPVVIDSAHQLGTISSSRQFKTNIESFPVDKFYDLEPVIFSRILDNGEIREDQEFGLIAEQVAQVDPRLVCFDEKGQPETVFYQYLSPITLAMCIDLRQQLEELEREETELLTEIEEYEKQMIMVYSQ